MKKIHEIIIGTNNAGKYKEISSLLPPRIKKYCPKQLNICSPEENGKTFEQNSQLKALYYSKKTNLVCLADDSGLEIELLNGNPGINSARWGGPKSDFNLAIKKVFKEMKKVKKNWEIKNTARFVCSLTLCWPSGKNFSSTGIVKGRILNTKKGNNGFGYDPIFVPNGLDQTFGELDPEIKLSIDHRFVAFSKIKTFFY